MVTSFILRVRDMWISKSQLNQLKNSIIEEYQSKIAEKDENINLLLNEKKQLQAQLQENSLKENKFQEEIENLKQDKKNSLKNLPKYLDDKGYQTLLGFKMIAPFLDKMMGRPFLLTIAEEFNYKETSDKDTLDFLIEESKKVTGSSFHCFRDEVKKDHSFRVSYYYTSKDYYVETAEGKKPYPELISPEILKDGGLEINNINKSAIYLALKTQKMQSAVLPASMFGAPLLSYSTPIFSDDGYLIGAVSFSNDITQIINIGQGLGDIVSSDSDHALHKLANVLKKEINVSENAALKIQEEASFTKEATDFIRKRGKEVIDIAERLKVLALNTAIESNKVGGTGKGVGVIAGQMKDISEITRKTLREIYEKSKEVFGSSLKVIDTATILSDSSEHLKREISVLTDTSVRMTNQKDELAAMVRMSIDEVAQSQEDLNNIFLMIKEQHHD